MISGLIAGSSIDVDDLGLAVTDAFRKKADGLGQCMREIEGRRIPYSLPFLPNR